MYMICLEALTQMYLKISFLEILTKIICLIWNDNRLRAYCHEEYYTSLQNIFQNTIRKDILKKNFNLDKNSYLDRNSKDVSPNLTRKSGNKIFHPLRIRERKSPERHYLPNENTKLNKLLAHPKKILDKTLGMQRNPIKANYPAMYKSVN